MKVIEYFKTNKFIVSSDLFNNGEFRLNSDFYEALATSTNFHKTETIPLKSIAKIFHPGITKRCYIENKEFGIPFLSTSDMQFYEATENKYVSIELSKNLKDYIVKEGYLLISRSGTIGNIAMVDKNLNGCAVTEHAIRVVLNDSNYFGFLYTFLSSEIGQKIIKGQKSGAVIDEIYDADIENLDIPQIDFELISFLNDKIQLVKKNREEALDLINQARSLVLSINNLPILNKEDYANPDQNNGSQIILTSLDEFVDGFRLDAHFYNPIAKTAIKNIQQCGTKYLLLEEVTTEIVIGKRFKRNYVDSDHGTPFIGSKNILQIRPNELKYLSNSEIGFMDDLILQKNMILVACSGSLGGTFGKACFVYNNFEKYAASQHILRVVANENLVDAGYLYAFLSSEYGYECITKYRWGALIDEIDDEDMSKLIIPIPSMTNQKQIGDLIRQAYNLRSDAIQLEDEAQEMLLKALTIE